MRMRWPSLLRAGEISATELLDAHLAVIERQGRALNAWQSVDAAGAREAAALRQTRGWPLLAAREAPRWRRCRRSSASRSRSRTWWSRGDSRRPPAAASSMATAGSTTPTSRSGWRRPGRSSRARPTWTSSPWAPRPSTAPGVRWRTPGTYRACPAAPRVARPPRSPHTMCPSPSAPTPGARSASLPP